jgi:parallel beta-helix repeat protein
MRKGIAAILVCAGLFWATNTLAQTRCPPDPPTPTPWPTQPTYTPRPTYTPNPTYTPTATCRPTYTPIIEPSPTPYPTNTPYPTSTPYPITPAPGQTYYVSPDGSDGDPGTPSQPWRSVQKAADAMGAGDTCIVLAGDYPERIQISKSGAPGSPVVFQAEGATVQGFDVTGDYVTVRGFVVTSSECIWQSGIYVSSSYVSIENNYLYLNPAEAVYLDVASSDCIVRNNRMQRCKAGLNVAGAAHLIEGNEIWESAECHPCGLDAGDADGMRVFGTGHIIRGNYIHDIHYGDPGCDVANGDYIDDGHVDCFQSWDRGGPVTDTVFEQNVCIVPESAGGALRGHGFMIAQGSDGVIVRNNLIVAYRGACIEDSSNWTLVHNTFVGDPGFTEWPTGIGMSGVSGMVIKNNIFYNVNADGDRHVIGDGDWSESNNLVYLEGQTPPGEPGTDDLWNINPQLADPTNGDYHLQAGSPCIDAGVDLGVTDDLDGISRPQGDGYDIGAYEYSVKSIACLAGRRCGRVGAGRRAPTVGDPVAVAPGGGPGVAGDGMLVIAGRGIKMVILDIMPITEKATVPLLLLLTANLRGWLALAACVATAWAVGLAVAVVDWVERHGRRG